MNRRTLLKAAAIAWLTPLAWAQQRGGYQVEVWAIRATKSNNNISPELRSIADELKDRFKFSGFSLEAKTREAVKEGDSLKTRLPAGYQVEVTPISKKEGRITMKVVARRGEKELAATTVRVGAGKGHLMGGWKREAKSDDVMILLIRAR